MEGLRPGDPERIGRYRLLNRLGAGGMGHVYLGQSPSGRLVAVKVIRAELADDPAFRQRFAQEVTAARRVGGMFTAPVVDADPDAPQPWMVTAYVSGPSLAEAVASIGPLPVTSVLMLAAGLAEGLGAVHAAGLVHRDLKPSNVLLASDGPRIIDFGISRAADSAALTRVGGVIGSPGFMSPEQAEGRQVAPASDMFSLGGVLAFAATGSPPFGEGSPSVLLYRVVRGQPALDAVPAELRPLIERCLAKDPAARPGTDDLLSELGFPEPSENWLSWHVAAGESATVPPVSELSQSAVAAGALAAGPVGLVSPVSGAPLADAAGRSGLVSPVIGQQLADAAGHVDVARLAEPLVSADAADLAGARVNADGAGWPGSLAVDERAAALGGETPDGEAPSGEAVSPPIPRAPLDQPPVLGGRRAAADDGDAPEPDPGRDRRRRLLPWLGAAAVLALVAVLLVAIGLAAHPKPGGKPRATRPSAHAQSAPGTHRSGPTGSKAAGAQTSPAAAGNGSSGAATAPSTPAASQTAAGASPVTVVIAYFTAINNKEWNLAWALGGKNLYPSYVTMVTDLTNITHDYVTIISSDGATVVASVRTVTLAGITLIHQYSYVVQDGTIVSGILQTAT